MEYKKRYLIIFLAALFNVSCGDWLDILPKSEVDERDMFKDADGYYAAYTGIYISMASAELYGGYLPLQLIEPLTQQYTFNSGNPEREKWSRFDYSGKEAESGIGEIWGQMYNAIVNCNLLIHHLRSDRPDYFEEGVAEIMLGEALGLRACMYFDLVRMYNDSPVVNANISLVPYKTDFGLSMGEKLSTSRLLEKVLADLEEARSLLNTYDPIVAEKSYKDKYVNYSRNQRMNYYAATALTARIQLYLGNYEQAYTHAQTVINSPEFRFITEEEIILKDQYGNESKIDRLFSPELLFAVYSESIISISRTYYDTGLVDIIKSRNCYHEGDLRREAWIGTNTSAKPVLIKYQRSTLQQDQSKYGPPLAPVLRLGEMYLIAAEAALQRPATGGNAIALLNELKTHRKTPLLPANASDSEIRAEITREYICEFKGEGQLFWYYKRLNMSDIDNGNYLGTTISVPEGAYTFPLPQYEIEFGTAKK